MEKSTAKKITPTSNKIQVSSKKDPGAYVFLAKLFLLDFEEIELHALGDAIGICVKVGESLVRYRYTDYTKIETLTITADEPQEGSTNPIRGKKAKFIIKLKRSKDFPELIKNFKVQKTA